MTVKVYGSLFFTELQRCAQKFKKPSEKNKSSRNIGQSPKQSLALQQVSHMTCHMTHHLTHHITHHTTSHDTSHDMSHDTSPDTSHHTSHHTPHHTSHVTSYGTPHHTFMQFENRFFFHNTVKSKNIDSNT